MIFRKINRRLAFRVCIWVAAIAALSSCGTSNVVIQGNFPMPNINKIPLAVGVHYEDALRTFSYMEYSETGKEEINIEIGDSHIQFFNVVLPAMFDSVTEVDINEDLSLHEIDVLFTPSVLQFQLALPEKTKLDVYEVWVEYNMSISNLEGDSLADFVMTAYGKTPKENSMTQSVEEGINEAAVIALRDLASSFSINFAQIPEVEEWLRTL